MRALGRKSGDDGADNMAFAEADGQDGAFDGMLDLSETWAEDDPYAKAGLFAKVRIEEWKKVIG